MVFTFNTPVRLIKIEVSFIVKSKRKNTFGDFRSCKLFHQMPIYNKLDWEK